MQSMEQMYDYARKLAAYHPERLMAIMQGRDDSLPQAIAMAALKERQAAQRQTQGVQALNQPNAKDQLIAEYGAQAVPDADESGVAALPAENMEFAQGGIVAFQEGGRASTRRPEYDPATQVPRPYVGVLPERTGYEGMGIGDFLRTAGSDAWRALSSGAESSDRALRQLLTPSPAPVVVDRRMAYGPDRDVLSSFRLPDETAPAQAASETGKKGSPGSGGAAPSGGGSFRVSASQKGSVGAGAGAGGTPGDYSKYFPKIDKPAPPDSPIYENTVRVPTAEEAVSEYEQLLKARGIDSNFMNEAEAKLRAQQERMPEDRKTAMWEAVMRAGLGMAAGKSQYALSNIAEGGIGGLEQYRDSMKELKKDEKERDRALADIRKAQFDIESGKVQRGLAARDAAQARADVAKGKVFDSQARAAELAANYGLSIYGTESQRATQQGVAALQGDLSREQIAAQERMTDKKIAAEIKAAGIRASGAGRLPEMLQIAGAMKTDPSLAGRLQQIINMKAEPQTIAGLQKQYTALLDKPAAKLALSQLGVKSFDDFQALLGSGGSSIPGVKGVTKVGP